MLMLSRDEILRYLDKRLMSIVPFQAHLLNPCSYYFCLGRRIHVFDSSGSLGHIINLEDGREFTLPPNGFVLGHSYEKFDLSLSKRVLMSISSPYSLIENGLQLCHSSTIDPYYSDVIQIGIKNLLPVENVLRYKMEIGKVTFFDIAENAPTVNDELSDGFRTTLSKALSNPMSSEITW